MPVLLSKQDCEGDIIYAASEQDVVLVILEQAVAMSTVKKPNSRQAKVTFNCQKLNCEKDKKDVSEMDSSQEN